MECLRCAPEDLPKYLYRVQYTYSQTNYSVTDGLHARDVETIYPERGFGRSDFESDLEKHLDWNTRGWVSPFISLLSDLNHAINWGCKRRQYWQLIAVSTSQLVDSGIYIFRLSDLARELGAEIVPERAEGDIPDGYFCLHRVPAKAIVVAVPNYEFSGNGPGILRIKIEQRIFERRQQLTAHISEVPEENAEDTNDHQPGFETPNGELSLAEVLDRLALALANFSACLKLAIPRSSAPLDLESPRRVHLESDDEHSP